MQLQPQRAHPSATRNLLPAFAGGWGPYRREAESMYVRARQAGMSVARATVAAFVSSFKDCWAFRKQIARVIGVSVRTVQRALTEASDLGLLRTARAKKGETPPGAKGPIDCGFSHRWTMGWGEAGKKAGAKIRAAIEKAKTRRLLSRAAPATRTLSRPEPKRRRILTVEELDAELARIDAERGARGS